ncbi:MAG: HAD family phosphatase [Bacteriovoracaceae bacterium]|nr:HAD family phosphatase [Bacteriovoracaceae bacterium]
MTTAAILASCFNQKQAVLFDMDGTILNTEPLHAKALQATLSSLGLPDYSASDLDQTYAGKSDLEVYQDLKDKLKATTMADFINLKNQQFIWALNELPELEVAKLHAPGIHSLLSLLKGHKIKLGLVSASERDVIDTLLKKSGLLPFFDITISRTDTTNSKPHPDPYLSAMTQLQVSCDQVLIFEDSVTGLQAAKQSGASVIQVDLHAPLTPTQRQSNKRISNFYNLQ